MTITVNNIQSVITGTDITVQTLSAYVVPSGNDKILIVGVTNENGSDVSSTSVKHNGVDLTLRKEISHDTGTIDHSELWELQLGSTTPSGDIVVTWPSAVAGSAISALTLAGAVQQAPEATASGVSATTSINTAIITITDNAMIVDTVGYGNATPVSITQGPDQVEDVSITDGDTNLAHGASHRLGDAAGSHTLGWSVASGRRLAHVLLAYEEISAGVTTRRYSLGLTGVG